MCFIKMYFQTSKTMTATSLVGKSIQEKQKF